MNHLHGSCALVTGASRGIGPHIARALARAGANVALTARDAPALEALAVELRTLGVKSVAVPVDLAHAGEREALVERATAELGSIDVLVNNAGVEYGGEFAALPADDIATMVELNMTAPIHLARLVLPGMLERRRGHIVTIASLGGKKGAPYDAVYSATKAGLIEWTGAVRGEVHGSGVSLSAVCPGFVTGEGMFAKFGIPPPRTVGSCTPQDVARAVVRAIQEDVPELIVNSVPVRPLLALHALSPRLGLWLTDRIGITEFQRKKVGAGPHRTIGSEEAGR